jgi:YesN/AraC family two-component response regulator
LKSDLLKKETVKNAQELIHQHLIEEAENKLMNTSDTINEIACMRGFQYPQYFCKLFKSKIGKTPLVYWNMN